MLLAALVKEMFDLNELIIWLEKGQMITVIIIIRRHAWYFDAAILVLWVQKEINKSLYLIR